MPGMGQLHDVFTGTVGDLQSQAKAQASAAHGSGDRPWQVPKKVVDVLDVPKIVVGFDRATANANYEALIANPKKPGTAGDVVSVKTQVDYVGVMERGFRARHCTPVRCMALAVGRRAGHGMPNGVFGGGVRKYAQDALKAGQT